MAGAPRLYRIGIALAVAGLVTSLPGTPAGGSPSPAPGPGIGTPLPAGWELCILQGVGAAATSQNIANLDEWQVAEGGSTDNTAAFNPFNTLRQDDVNGAALPAVVSSNSFPAYANWAAGCAATVATLLQSNMTAIVTALRAGNVSPAGAFLADVDQSQWCAPSNGVPCYVGEITAASGVAAAVLDQASTALAIFGSVRTDLLSYVQDIAATAAGDGVLASNKQDLAAAKIQVSMGQEVVDSSARALRHLALDEYTGNDALNPDNGLRLFEPQSSQGVLAEFYSNEAATSLVERYAQAVADLKSFETHRDEAAAAVSQATAALAAAHAAQDHALSQLDSDEAALQTAGACAAVPAVTAASTPAGTPAPTAPAAAPAPTAPGAPAPTAPTGTQGSMPPAGTPAPAAPTGTQPAPAPAPTGTQPSPAPVGTPGSTAPTGVEALQGCLASLAPPDPGPTPTPSNGGPAPPAPNGGPALALPFGGAAAPPPKG